MNALVWNKGRWSLHLFPLSQTNRRLVDAAQARFLRRLTKIPAAYYSRVSHERVRKRCFSTPRFSTFIFRAQLRWLGHILRKPRTDPLKRILFEPRTNFQPVQPPSPFTNRPAKRKVGRPPLDWAQTIFAEIYHLSRTDRGDVALMAQDRRKYQIFVERLCNMFDRT